MNKILSYCTLLACSMLALMLGACTDEYEYTGATAEGEQVYFKTGLASKIDLDITKNSFQVEINRIQSKGELTVGIKADTKANSIYSVPATVTFADGQTSANIDISYNPEVVKKAPYGYGYYEDITLSVDADEYKTPYGNSATSFSAGLTEWIETGKEAMYRDGLMSALFSIEPMTYKVKIEKSNVKEGRYRLANPYGEGTPVYDAFAGTRIHLNNNHGIVFDISNPDRVIIDGTTTPGTFDSDNINFFAFTEYLIQNGQATMEDLLKDPSAEEFFGKLENGVITMLPQTFVATIGADGPYYANDDGMFTIAMPGYEIADYSSSFTYTGRFTDVAKNEFALGTIKLGEDVAAARWVLAADGDDIDEIIKGIKDGSIESNYITENEDVRIQLTESGTYTIVVVAYDKNGEAKGSSATQFKFSLGTENTSHDWQAIYVGNFRYNAIPTYITDRNDNYVGSVFQTGTQETVLYQDANNPESYRLYPWGLTEDGLIFEIKDGIASFKDVETGVVDKDFGMVYVADINTKDNVGQPTSGMIQTGLQFGNVYYVQAGYWGGAYEFFDITAEATNSSYMVKAIESRNAKKINTRKLSLAKRSIEMKAKRVKSLKVK